MTEPVRPVGLVGPVPPGVRDAAIEAAARAAFADDWFCGMTDGVDLASAPWDKSTDAIRNDYRKQAAAVLDAVLGVLAAHQDDEPLRRLAQRLVAMDDPQDEVGCKDRQTITLNALITQAREALAVSGD